MKKSYRTFMIAALVVFVSVGVLGAQDRERGGEVRGVFVRLAERRVGERGYMGIVVKPFERDEPVTVLVPREYEELARSARTLREGDRLEISFVTEHEEMWIKGIEAIRRRERGERDPDGDRRVEIRRENRREPERDEERRERERQMEIPRDMRRDPDRTQERREDERRIVIRREGERRPEAHREERLRREPSPQQQLEGQLRDVIAGNVERMCMELREVLAFNIERMEAELHELRAHVENMHREMDELRHENEMLRRQLRETNEPRREDDREARERRELDRRRDEIERHEREMQQEREHVERMEAERREGRERDDRDIPRDGDRDERR